MQLIRTSLRIKRDLKRLAEKHALDEDMSLQDVFNSALEEYLRNKAEKRVKKIVFKTHDLGVPLDNLTRTDYYSDPRF